jgi:hypothetical protein
MVKQSPYRSLGLRQTCPKPLRPISSGRPLMRAAFFRSLIFYLFFGFFFFLALRRRPPHFFLIFFFLRPPLSPSKRFPSLPFEILPMEDPEEERRFLPRKGGRAPPACALIARPSHGRPCDLQPPNGLVS